MHGYKQKNLQVKWGCLIMIKNYIRISRNFFKLKANNKKLLTLLVISYIMDCLIALTLPFFTAGIVEYATKRDFGQTFFYIGALAISYVLYNIFYHWSYMTYAHNANYTYNKMQEMVAEKVVNYDEGFSKKLSKAYLINTTSNDIWNACGMHDNIFDILANVIYLVFSVTILCTVNIYIGLFSLFITLIYLYWNNRLTKKRDIHLAGQRRWQDKIVGLCGEVIDGNKEIKTFDMKDGLNNHLNVMKRGWSKEYFLKRKYYDKKSALLPGILQIGKIILYIALIFMLAHQKITIGILVLIIGYYDEIYDSDMNINSLYNNLCSNSVRVDRLNKILNYRSKNMIEEGLLENDDIFGIVDFEHVDFIYDKTPILKDINLHFEPKALYAIVGHSGSGKSTIFRLLLRLYKPTKGGIYIDGTDIFSYSKEVYASNVGVATQKPFIFNMTIKENLDLVDSNVEHQIEACKRVGIHDFIMSLPKGYQTILKEDATNVSGGQKQLIALARTLLSNAEILLFDEVTSSLDPNTTKQVIHVLKDLKKDHTIIMITHKPSLMKIADSIIVIDQGKIVGTGKHKKLLEKNKYYQRLQR